MYPKAFPTLFIGRPIIILDSIDSTNTYAYQLIAKSNPSEGTAIFAYNQTDGKGQFGRKWISIEGQSIALSIILKPHFVFPTECFILSVIPALALAELVENYIDKQIFIKWPNDIYVNDNKLAGILIENSLSRHKIDNSIIGIGINVNQTKFDDSLPNPTSFAIESNKNYQIMDLLNELFHLVEKYYLLAKQGDIAALFDEYNKRLYQLDILKEYTVNGAVTEGVIKGVANNGHLKVEVNNQELLLSLNEIRFNR